MSSVIEWFLRDNHWIRMVLLNLPIQIFCIKIMELLLGKMKHRGCLLGFMLVRTTLMCYLQALGDQVSVTGHMAELVLGALGSIGACLICFYLFEAEPIKILFAIAISELSAMPPMIFSLAVLNWIERRPEGMFGWYLTFRPEDLLAWIFELLFFLPGYAVIKRFQTLFQEYEIRHTRLIWIIYLVYFLIMQTSQIIPIATEEGTRAGMVMPCLVIASGTMLGIAKVFSNQNEKIQTEIQFQQMEMGMMQSQYQAMQCQRSHIEESQELIDRQMQEIMRRGEQAEKQTQIAEYLRDLEKVYQNVHAGIYCREWTLDAILYVEIEQARKQGMEVQCQIQNYPQNSDDVKCMGKILMALFEFALLQEQKKSSAETSRIYIQMDDIAGQEILMFTCQEWKKVSDLKKKIQRLIEDKDGNVEIERMQGQMRIGVTFAEESK